MDLGSHGELCGNALLFGGHSLDLTGVGINLPGEVPDVLGKLADFIVRVDSGQILNNRCAVFVLAIQTDVRLHLFQRPDHKEENQRQAKQRQTKLIEHGIGAALEGSGADERTQICEVISHTDEYRVVVYVCEVHVVVHVVAGVCKTVVIADGVLHGSLLALCYVHRDAQGIDLFIVGAAHRIGLCAAEEEHLAGIRRLSRHTKQIVHVVGLLDFVNSGDEPAIEDLSAELLVFLRQGLQRLHACVAKLQIRYVGGKQAALLLGFGSGGEIGVVLKIQLPGVVIPILQQPRIGWKLCHRAAGLPRNLRGKDLGLLLHTAFRQL